MLDKIITNGLAIRLGDASFAEEIYADLRQQAIGIPERLHDTRISIKLSPLPSDRPNPRLRTLVALAEVLDVDPDELLPHGRPGVSVGR